MNIKFTLTALILCVSMAFSYAQTSTIKGMVIEQTSQEGVVGAYALLNQDGKTKFSVSTNQNGFFKFEKVPFGKYELKITFLGFEDFTKAINADKATIPAGRIQLLEDKVQLNIVEIKEKAPIAVVKGDTTEYNADRFKTNPDASAEDLIQKMPGVTVQDGKVQAEGEDVKQVLVDGKPFFGNDPTAALRNLPAEVISKIEVFDQKSDQAQFSGFDDGQTTKTINIITRPGKNNGQFGKVYAGYGYEDKYRVGGSTNFFNGSQRISIIGQSNNINIQNFATEDLLGVVGSGGRGRRGRRGGGGGGRGGGFRGGRGSSANDFLISAQNGISQTHAIGINYSDQWSEKVEVSASYFWNNAANEAIQNTFQEYFQSDAPSQVYNENSLGNSTNTNHRMNMRLEYKMDERNSIIFRPSLTFQTNDGQETILGATNDFNNTLLNSTDNVFQSNLDGLSFSNNLLYRHRFEKRGRTFSVRLSGGYNDNTGDSELYSENAFLRQTLVRDTIDQVADFLTNNWNVSTNVSYSEPLNEKSSLMLTYRISQQAEDSDKETLDFVETSNAYTNLNTQLSNIFKNTSTSHSTGLGYNYRIGREVFLMARLNAQWSTLDNNQQLPQTDTWQKTYFNVLPMFMLRIRNGRTKNIRFFYRTNTQLPSITQLQNVVDNSNPLQLSAGNPDLNQQLQHTVSFRYNSTNTETASIFYTLIGGGVTQDYIGNSTYLSQIDDPIFADLGIQPGTQLSQPVNLSGYWNARAFVTYGFPVIPIKSNLNINLSANYSKEPGLINREKNFAKNANFGLGVTLSSNISKQVDFTIASQTSYNDVENTIQTSLDNNYLSQTTSAKLTLISNNGWVFRTNLSHQFFDGYAEDFDDSFFLLNATIGKKLFKNQLGEISLTAFDILEQNQSISRNVTETYIEDLQNNVLQRYLMLTFTYNFRNFTKK